MHWCSLDIVLVVNLFFSASWAIKICRKDDDCASLGSLQCIKSKCDWGMCACPRGKVSRYLGSERLYKCVPMKKVGESCSDDDSTGTCGAEDSYCINGKCDCPTGYHSRFGGELCTRMGSAYATEMQAGNVDSCRGLTSSGNLPAVLSGGPRICSCPRGSQVQLSNTYGGEFQGKKRPKCIPIMIGETCLDNADCQSIGGETACIDNKCVCNATDHVAEISKQRCGTAMKFGDVCVPGVGGVCAGSEGLFCGKDVCELNNQQTESTDRCTCYHTHVKEGTACKPREIGSSCYGDENCKGINHNAICVAGECQNNGTKRTLCFGLLLAMLVFNFI